MFCDGRLSSGGTSWDISGPPQISHESKDGWFRKVHRGHWKEASGSEDLGGLCLGPGDSAPPTSLLSADRPRGRSGSGATTGCLLVALFMAAFSTWVSAGLMPHARQGGRGVCGLAVAGSKLEGTGLEKLQMVQTQVAAVEGDGSGGAGCSGLSDDDGGSGEAVPTAGDLDCCDERLAGFGMSVTFGDDLRNPACLSKAFSARPQQKKLFLGSLLSHSIHVAQCPSGPMPQSSFWGLLCLHSRPGARSSRPVHSVGQAACTF